MTYEIRQTKSDIEACEDRLHELWAQLLEQTTRALADKGIVQGTRVLIRYQYSGAHDYGIFQKCFVAHGSVRAHVAKIKKDGSAHATAAVYCHTADELELADNAEVKKSPEMLSELTETILKDNV